MTIVRISNDGRNGFALSLAGTRRSLKRRL
jgi:hypothetical protein